MNFFRNSYSSFFFKISDTVEVLIPNFLAYFWFNFGTDSAAHIKSILFLTKVEFAYVLLGVDETFYACVPVSMK